MNVLVPLKQDRFRPVLTPDTRLQAGQGVLSATLFPGPIGYLLSALSWVDHTERVIGNVNEVSKLNAEIDTGMRGLSDHRRCVLQAALENRLLQFDDVPAVRSGQAARRPVLVVPLHHDTQVTGVVELAFFRALVPPDLALTELVANVIGTALRGLVSRTSDCLAKPIDTDRLFSLLRSGCQRWNGCCPGPSRRARRRALRRPMGHEKIAD